MTDTADRLLQRFRAQPVVSVSVYLWSHRRMPDGDDVVGGGRLVMPSGPGELDVALITRRMLERGDRAGHKTSVREIVRAMARPSRLELDAGDVRLAEPDPRWFIEVLRGVETDVAAPLEIPDADVDWTGVTNLLRARAESNHDLRLPLRRSQLLPGHPARRRAARAEVGVMASPGRASIAIRHDFGLTAPASWSAVALEAAA